MTCVNNEKFSFSLSKKLKMKERKKKTKKKTLISAEAFGSEEEIEVIAEELTFQAEVPNCPAKNGDSFASDL